MTAGIILLLLNPVLGLKGVNFNMGVNMQRIESLDYLRGVMALSVMFYHYLSWSIYEPSMGGEFVLGKLGIYAVSFFYILSGLSLSIVYGRKIETKQDVISFYIKRISRILPLFWLATSIAIAYKLGYQIIRGDELNFPLYSAIINYTLSFGFLDHDTYLATGAWSIGNELVFYAILPIIIFIGLKIELLFLFSFMLSLCVGGYFAFFLLDPSAPLSGLQWSLYINPFNQLFLFLGGVVIGRYGFRFKLSDLLLYSLLIFSLLVFIFLPTVGDKIGIITGANRFIMSFACFGVVLSIYLLNPVFKGILAKALSFLGECCYSIYLLHPLVAFPIVYLGGLLNFDKVMLYIICVPITLVCSWLCFKYIEEPSMRYGKIVVTKLKGKAGVESS